MDNIYYVVIGVLGCCVWAHGYGLIAVLEYKLSSIRQVTTYRQHSTLSRLQVPHPGNYSASRQMLWGSSERDGLR